MMPSEEIGRAGEVFELDCIVMQIALYKLTHDRDLFSCSDLQLAGTSGYQSFPSYPY